jgi:hypothetical protein
VDNDSGYDTIGLKMVVAYLEHVFEEVLGTYEKMTQKGVVSYSGLGYMFRKDVKVYGKHYTTANHFRSPESCLHVGQCIYNFR